MLSQIAEYIAQYNKAVLTNPVLAGFSLYVTGILTYLLRNVPIAIWRFVIDNITIAMTMDNSGYMYGSNEAHYNAFQKWFMENKWSRWSRTIHTQTGIARDGDATGVLNVPGIGFHFFFEGGKLFWFKKEIVPTAGTDKEKTRITLKTLGRSHVPFYRLIESFTPKQESNTIPVKYWNGHEWTKLTYIEKRNLDSVIIRQDIKDDLVRWVKRFVENKVWFTDRALPYKLTIMFKGKPGTGKTSLVKAIASHFDRTIHLMDLSEMSNKTFLIAVHSIEPGGLLLLEDIDAAGKSVINRDDKQSGGGMGEMFESRLTLATILNTLDGVIPLNDLLIFTTTNHPEKLDPALTRKSRIDKTYEIGDMGNEEIHRYAEFMYPGEHVRGGIVFDPLPGCEVYDAFKESDDVHGFVRRLTKTTMKVA